MRTKKNAFDAAIAVYMAVSVFVFLFPFWYIFVISISTGESFAADPYHFIPHAFNLEEYKKILTDDYMLGSLGISAFITVVGTALSLVLTIPCAYALSKREFFLQKPFIALTIFPMIFSGGLIPYYIVVTKLGLSNSVWALILPMGVSSYNLIVSRSFMNTIPPSLEESARIDGASDLRIFASIIVPLSKPLITAIGMFYAIAIYNDYWNAMLFISSRNMYPIQMVLREMVINNQGLGPMASALQAANRTSEVMKMASVIIGILPILCVYPFVQKYFAQGVMLGAVKE